MHIIWLVPEMPFPLNSGGKIGIYKRIVELSKYNQIYLFSIIDHTDEYVYTDSLTSFCNEIHLYDRSASMLNKMIKSLVLPYVVSSRYMKKMCEDIICCIQQNHIDVILVDFPQMALNILHVFKKYPNLPIVLNQHNIEYKTMRQLSHATPEKVKKIIFRFDSWRLAMFEKSLYKKNLFSAYTFVSKDDKMFFENNLNKQNKQTVLIPVGTDMCTNGHCIKNGFHHLLFVGKMSYPPNIEGCIWFVNKVLPLIKQSIPDIKFYIVGRDPVCEILNLRSENVIVTGTVDSVQEYYGTCDVIVIPLLSGGGVKVKLLEALSYKKLIITTSKGIEGTDFIDGKHLLVCDLSEDFAHSCINSMENACFYQTIVDNITDKLINEHSWGNVGLLFHHFLENVAEASPCQPM